MIKGSYTEIVPNDGAIAKRSPSVSLLTHVAMAILYTVQIFTDGSNSRLHPYGLCNRESKSSPCSSLTDLS